jgi:hypothetical protein
MSIIYKADYFIHQDYILTLHHKILSTKWLCVFCKELQVKRLEYDYYDDIYPSILKFQASPFKSLLLSIYFNCKCLCNNIYSAIRLWYTRV